MTGSARGAPDRFTTPLYTVTEAARYLDVPATTFASWAHGYRRQKAGQRPEVGAAVLTALPRVGGRGPVIPFVGLAEGLVLTAIRSSGVPLQRIRPALVRLEQELGLSQALASKRLDFGDDGYARLIHLPAYETAEVVVDQTRGFGQPIFARGGARLKDVLSLFRTGEPLESVAAEYGVPPVQLEDAVRIATRVAA